MKTFEQYFTEVVSGDKLAAQVAARKAARMAKNAPKKAAKTAAAPKKSTGRNNTSAGTVGGNESDNHIVMQMRNAQDLGGDKEIKFRRGSAKMDQAHMRAILKYHDMLPKPDQKRAFRIQLKDPKTAAKIGKLLVSKGL